MDNAFIDSILEAEIKGDMMCLSIYFDRIKHLFGGVENHERYHELITNILCDLIDSGDVVVFHYDWDPFSPVYNEVKSKLSWRNRKEFRLRHFVRGPGVVFGKIIIRGRFFRWLLRRSVKNLYLFNTRIFFTIKKRGVGRCANNGNSRSDDVSFLNVYEEVEFCTAKENASDLLRVVRRFIYNSGNFHVAGSEVME